MGTKHVNGRQAAVVEQSGRAVVESLEGRQMLAAHIAGAVFSDMTGNGLTSDDRRAGAGIVMNLYHDVNNDGRRDAGDGAAVATTLTKGNGRYRFSDVTLGNYLVEEVLPGGAVRTHPKYSDVREVDVLENKVYRRVHFAHYDTTRNDMSQVTNVTYVINGTTVVTTLAGNVKQGDTVEARFTLLSRQTVSLVSYKASDPLGQPLSEQYIYDKATARLKAGTYSMKVEVPNCYFQVDFVAGRPIDHFGEPTGYLTYTDQNRLFSAAVGGDNANPAGTTWATREDDSDIVVSKGKFHGVFFFHAKSGTFKAR